MASAAVKLQMLLIDTGLGRSIEDDMLLRTVPLSAGVEESCCTLKGGLTSAAAAVNERARVDDGSSAREPEMCEKIIGRSGRRIRGGNLMMLGCVMVVSGVEVVRFVE